MVYYVVLQYFNGVAKRYDINLINDGMQKSIKAWYEDDARANTIMFCSETAAIYRAPQQVCTVCTYQV